MDHSVSSENTSFAFLRSSPGFMQKALNNINSCVMLFDNKMYLQAFNDAMKTIFSNYENEHLLYKKCGNAIGCAYAVEEKKVCGNTSNCEGCSLRKDALMSYSQKKAIYKQRLDRYFYKTDQTRVLKHLQYSTRHFYFENDQYIIVIIEDITRLVQQQSLISLLQKRLSANN